MLRAERPEIDVPDDPVHLLARRAEPDRLLGVRERRHDELVPGRDRLPHELSSPPPFTAVRVDVGVPRREDERVHVGPCAPPAVRQEVVRVHEVDVEPLCQTANRGAETEAAQALDARQPREVADVVDGQPLELVLPVRDPVGDDVHLVAALGEPPGPAQEDDRLSVADTQQAKGSVGHGAAVYPRPLPAPGAAARAQRPVPRVGRSARGRSSRRKSTCSSSRSRSTPRSGLRRAR